MLIHNKGFHNTDAVLYYYHSAIKFPSSIYEPILYQNSIWISATLFWHAEKRACAFSFFTPNNIQSWPQKHKFFFLLSPKNRKSKKKHSSETIFLCLMKSSLQNGFKICHFCKGINTNPKLLLDFSKSVLVLYFSLTKNSDFFKCPFHQV